MEKYRKGYLLAWVISVAAFIGVAFLIPRDVGLWSKDRSSFWAAFVVVLAMFAMQLGCSILVFRKGNPQQRFLRLPIIYISYAALFTTLVVEIRYVTTPLSKNWVGYAVGVVILAIYAIAVIAAVQTADAIEKTGQKVKEETQFMISLRAEAELMPKRAGSPEAAALAKKVSEAVRYSDPRGNAALKELEGRAYAAFLAFSEAAKEGKEEQCREKAEAFLLLLEERNTKCKLMK